MLLERLKFEVMMFSGIVSRQKTFSNSQAGASGLAILIVLFMAAFVGLCAVKLYAPFYDQWTIMSIVDGFQDEPDLESISAQELEVRFRKRLQSNGVREIDFDESIFIEKDEISAYFEIDYERTINIYKNVDAVVVFKESVEHPYP